MQDVKNVVVHNLSPGMVTTDLLMSGATTKRSFLSMFWQNQLKWLRIHPCQWIMKPTYIRFLTGLKAYTQIFSELIFERPPHNVHKVVLATNMAEASITINDIVFVIDCGKAKETTYDALNNTPCLLPSWISQASARQLAGTAKSRFSAKDYSDYMALVRAYEGWKDAEREGSAYEYC
nr:DExH-box ATP-dependent RNA helicase DExH5, mitochondrial-like [Ziziphus jujuba var. spinosa]